MAVSQNKKTPSAFQCLLESPVFLKEFISRTETGIRREKEQLKNEQEAHSREMEKLTIFERPMNAPYWRRRQEEISQKERQLEAAKTKLRELEK